MFRRLPLVALRERIESAWFVLRGGRFDLSTEVGRAQDRVARLMLSTLSAATLRGGSFTVNMVSISLLFAHLDEVSFGLWLTLMSIWAILQLVSDAGMSGGIINSTARAYGRGSDAELREAVSNGAVALGIAGLTFGLATVGASIVLPWDHLLNIPSESVTTQFETVFAIMGIAIALLVASGLYTAVMAGLQMAYMANLWVICAFATGLLTMMIAMRLGAGFIGVAAAFFLSPAFVMVVANLRFVLRSPTSLKPRWSVVNSNALSILARTGGALFLIKLITGLTSFSDSLLVGYLLGPAQVPEVAIPARLFNIVALAVAVLTTPLWPAYAQAIGSGDIAWILRTFRRSMVFAIAIGVPTTICFVIWHEWILHVWLGPEYVVKPTIIMGFAIWSVIEIIATVISMLLIAGQAYRLQVVLGLAFLVLSVLLRVTGILYIGTEAVPYATCIAYCVAVFGPLVYFLPRFLRNLGSAAVIR